MVLAFEFPPVNAGGTMRAVRLANHFAERGLECRVVCADPPTLCNPNLDNSLEKIVDKRIRVDRIPLVRPLTGLWGRLVRSGYTTHPDELTTRWTPALRPKLESVLSEWKPDFIFVTMPPFSLHSIVSWLRDISNVTIVADLRDAWSHWIMTPFPSYVHYLCCLRNERRLLATADLVTVSSPVALEDFARLHRSVPPNKLIFMPNTYDQYTSSRFQPLNPNKENLDVLYVGSFYYNPASQALFTKPWYKKKPHQWLQYFPRMEDWSYRGPTRLLRAFDELLRDKRFLSRVKLTFAGKRPEWWDQVIDSERLKRSCKHIGMLSKEQTLERVNASDALLVTSSKVIGGRDYSIAGKTFEYFAARKPILGMVADGAQRDILRDSGISVCLDPDNHEESVERLIAFFSGRLNLAPDDAFLARFRTEAVGDELLERIGEVTRR